MGYDGDITAEGEKMTDTLTYSVPGIHCEHCARAIREGISEIGGVETIDVDLAGKVVTVRGDALSDADLRAAIAEAGYEAA